MTAVTFGSVCSGIEAASVAWNTLGWRAVWLAEIEPTPCVVLKHHYPDVPNLGNMLGIPAMLRNGDIPAPDVLAGGTPCQAFSVAGLRASLKDARGNLSMTFCEIADEIDIQRAAAGLLPCVIKWENVPGVLATKDNAFGCFLGGLAGEGEALVPEPCPAAGKSGRFWKWDKKSGQHTLSWPKCGVVFGPKRAVAWRILDAQYFGLAQRRKRLFVVASAREGFDPAAVLLEFDGVRRDTAPCRETSEDIAGTVRASAACRGGIQDECGLGLQPVGDAIRYAPTISHCLNAGGMGRIDYETEAMIVDRFPIGFNAQQDPDSWVDRTGPLAAGSTQAQAVCVTGDITHTLKAEGFDASEDGTGRGQPIVAVGTDVFNGLLTGDVAATMGTRGSSTNASGPTVMMDMAVRRLMPIECARLQGFPDDYLSQVIVRGKPVADGPMYKALGNSWAIPNVRWIGARIDIQLKARP